MKPERQERLRRVPQLAKLMEAWKKFESYGERFEHKVSDLEAWLAQTGRLPARKSKDGREAQLAEFLSLQRQAFCRGTMELERQERLSRVLELRALVRTWQELVDSQIAEMEAWLESRGRLPLPGSLDYEEARLGRFLSSQRRAFLRGAMKPGRQERFEQTPMTARLLRDWHLEWKHLAVTELEYLGRFETRVSEMEGWVKERGRWSVSNGSGLSRHQQVCRIGGARLSRDEGLLRECIGWLRSSLNWGTAPLSETVAVWQAIEQNHGQRR